MEHEQIIIQSVNKNASNLFIFIHLDYKVLPEKIEAVYSQPQSNK